jgi:hypothetical protein
MYAHFILSSVPALSSGPTVRLFHGQLATPDCATVGRELMDLDAARDSGALTHEEYMQKRQEILGSRQ